MNPKFTITDDMLTKCTKFAEDSVGTSADKYARRQQFNINKIQDDIRNGKLGELAVWQKLVNTYPNLSQPDFNIYDKKQKSWDPDLKDADSALRVGVKSQDIKSAINYGDSWVFQFGNGKKYDCDTGIFGEAEDNHFVSFVSLNVPKRIGEIRGIVKVKWLHDNNLFKSMKLAKLQGNKVAVYLDDLNQLQNQLWQLVC